MNSTISPESELRTAILAPDMITGSGLFALLSDCESIKPVAWLDATEYHSLSIYDPVVVLWDFGWSVERDDSLAADVRFSDPGRIDGIPVLGLVSDATQSGTLWRLGVRSMIHRSATPDALVSGLHSTALGLWTLSPEIAEGVFAPGSGAPALMIEPLTEREQNVLNLLAEGLTNRAIAQRLSISEHTVKFHVNSILGKLNAESRTDAVVRAMRAGLILL